MRISEIEERLADYGSGGYYLLESYLLQLLKLEADSQNKPLQLEDRRSHSRYDAFAPNGIADLPGPLAIEIVQVLSPRRLNSEIHRHESLRGNDGEKLLIVSFREMGSSSEYVQKLKARSNERVFFWGAEEVQTLLDKHSEKAVALSKNMFAIRFQRAISKSSEDWKEKRTEVLAEVCEHYRSGRFSMLLGAGVSSSAGLPDWNTLLNSLFVSMLTEGGIAQKKTDNEQVSSIVKRLRHL